MACALPLHRANRREISPPQRVIQGTADAPDCKGEEQTLDVEPGALSEFEEAWWVLVYGNVNRFGESEKGGDETYAPHHLAVAGVRQIEPDPRQQEYDRPCQPCIVISHTFLF